MSIYVSATIRRYVGELTRFGHAAPFLGELDALAAIAMDEGRDLPYARLRALFDYLADGGPADIGLRCGSGRRLAELGIVGHAIASSQTLGAALRIAIAHNAGSDELRQIQFQTRGGEWIVEIRTAPGLPHGVRRLVCEEWIATFFASLAEVTQITRPDVRIELDYAALPDVDYARWLPATPLFGRKRCKLVFPAELLEQRLVSYDHDMLQLILRHFAERPVSTSFAERLTRYLVLNEGKPPKVADAAAHIGVSERTLIRRLAEEGTTYSKLLDEHRRGYALALARDGQLGLKQISAALGYRSEQSFKRAFVNWTGKPLRRWRRDAGIGRRGARPVDRRQ